MSEASVSTQKKNKKPQGDHIYNNDDLIQFSDTDFFEEENLGKGFCCI